MYWTCTFMINKFYIINVYVNIISILDSFQGMSYQYDTKSWQTLAMLPIDMLKLSQSPKFQTNHFQLELKLCKSDFSRRYWTLSIDIAGPSKILLDCIKYLQHLNMEERRFLKSYRNKVAIVGLHPLTFHRTRKYSKVLVVFARKLNLKSKNQEPSRVVSPSLDEQPFASSKCQ